MRILMIAFVLPVVVAACGTTSADRAPAAPTRTDLLEQQVADLQKKICRLEAFNSRFEFRNTNGRWDVTASPRNTWIDGGGCE